MMRMMGQVFGKMQQALFGVGDEGVSRALICASGVQNQMYNVIWGHRRWPDLGHTRCHD